MEPKYGGEWKMLASNILWTQCICLRFEGSAALLAACFGEALSSGVRSICGWTSYSGSFSPTTSARERPLSPVAPGFRDAALPARSHGGASLSMSPRLSIHGCGAAMYQCPCHLCSRNLQLLKSGPLCFKGPECFGHFGDRIP